MDYYEESAKKLPVRKFDVVVAGGGTGGLIAAIAAARQGARTALIENKGYVGGIAVEGGTALHSFYNLWKAFPGVAKRQVVNGIPQELIDRLAKRGGTSGHAEMEVGFDYDSVCTAVDTELYKLTGFEMLLEAGVDIYINTLVAGAAVGKDEKDPALTLVRGVMTESRSGRELFTARSFVDATGAGDLCAGAGARFNDPNDYTAANSIGVGGVSLEGYHKFMVENDALTQFSRGMRDARPDQIVRLDGRSDRFPEKFRKGMEKIGMSAVVTSVHDGYFMFLKLNTDNPVTPTNRTAVTTAEIELRRRQADAVELFRKYVPGCEKAFIARSSPSICIRRGRQIVCDYDMTNEDIVGARHFEDDIMAYGFHDMAPRCQVKGGGTYGIPYRALCVSGISNLLACGMMITSNQHAHMSTRNTVCCMGQGQAAGTAAALCAEKENGSRELEYGILRKALLKDGVYLEPV